jgi:hypothetical protein
MVGDQIESWFKTIDTTREDTNNASDQLYLMVANGLTSATGSAADCKQQIIMDFNKTGTNGQTFPGLVQLNSDTGLVEPMTMTTVSNKMRLTLTLDGGQGVLLKFNTGSAFVGVQSTGDFDANGIVDGADLLRFQRGLGAAFPAVGNQGDGNYDLSVNAQDLALWKSHYGGASTVSAAGAVPEPAACMLLLSAAALLYRRSRLSV